MNPRVDDGVIRVMTDIRELRVDDPRFEPVSAAASAASDAPATRPARGWRRLGWGLVAVPYLVTAGAWLYPADWAQAGGWAARGALLAFLFRVGVWHFGLAAAAVGAGLLLLRQWRMTLALVPLLAFTLGPDLWSYVPKSPAAPVGTSVRIMSVNLLASNRDPNAVLAEIRAVDPDVLALVEYTPAWQAALGPALRARLPVQHHAPRNDCFGIGIYARTPFAAPVDDALGLGGLKELRQARTVIRVGTQEVAFYTVHLVPPMGTRNFAEQQAELADLLKHVAAERRPVIVCGDFNLTTRSSLGAWVAAAGLQDVHDLAGAGRGATWPASRRVPQWLGIRIDHIYVSEGLTATQTQVSGQIGSDHRAIWGEIGATQ